MDYIKLNIHETFYDNFYENVYDNVYNFFIDKNIIINENDTLSNKLYYFLLKYKKIIASFLFIVLLLIGYNYNLYYFRLDRNNKIDRNNKKCLDGGANNTLNAEATSEKTKAKSAKTPEGKAAISATVIPKAGKIVAMKASMKAGISKAGKSTVAGIKAAPRAALKFGERRAEDIKEFAPWFYGIIYSIVLTLLAFIIILPPFIFGVIGVICYVLLRDKIGFIKGL